MRGEHILYCTSKHTNVYIYVFLVYFISTLKKIPESDPIVFIENSLRSLKKSDADLILF